MVSKLVGIFRFEVQWLRIDFIATESLVSSKLLSTRSRTGSTYNIHFCDKGRNPNGYQLAKDSCDIEARGK